MCWFVSVYIWSQNVRRVDDSFLPRRLWQAGRGGAGKEGPAQGPKEVALHPPLFAMPAGPAGAAQKEHLLLLRNASAGGMRKEALERLLQCPVLEATQTLQVLSRLTGTTLWFRRTHMRHALGMLLSSKLVISMALGTHLILLREPDRQVS